MRILILSVLSLFSISAYCQMSGIYSVGDQSSDYHSLQAAVSALEENGIDGHVQITLADGSYDESLVINSIPGTEMDWTVTVRSALNDRGSVILRSITSGDNALWTLQGVEKVRFTELTFANMTATGKTSLRMDQACADIEFISCDFISEGDMAASAHIETETGCGSVTMNKCRFSGAQTAISAHGGANAQLSVLNSDFNDCETMISCTDFDRVDVENCQFAFGEEGVESNAVYARGDIDVLNLERNTFSGNIVKSIDMDIASTVILLDGNTFGSESSEVFISSASKVQLTKNVCAADKNTQVNIRGCVSNIIQDNVFNGLNVFNFAGSLAVLGNTFDLSAVPGTALLVENAILNRVGQDLIAGNVFKGNMDCTPMDIAAVSTIDDKRLRIQNNSFANMSNSLVFRLNDMPVDVCFNSIAANGAQSRIFEIDDVSEMDFRNNIVTCDGCSGITVYDNPSGSAYTAAHNVYDWERQSNGTMTYSKGADDEVTATIADAQEAGLEENTIQATPQFFDPMSDLRICNEFLFQKGVAIEGVDTDFFGNTRAGTPTPGIHEFSPLSPDFTYAPQGFTVSFAAEEMPTVTEYLWDFGDGTTSTEEFPTHTYAEEGVYFVTLTVNDMCNSPKSILERVTISVTDVDDFENRVVRIYPNPFKNELRVRMNQEQSQLPTVSAIDITGRQVYTSKLVTAGSELIIDTSDWMVGVYFVQFSYEGVVEQTMRVIKR